MNELKIFGLGASIPYADSICMQLGMKRSEHKDISQDDGEPYILSKENVRGCDVFIISSIFNTPDDSLCNKFLKTILFARSLRDASAKRITLVCPYLAFQRQDRKTESRAPVYTKYIPEIVEGILRQDDRIITIDAHNLSAYQSGFRLMIDHLEAKNVVCNWLNLNIKNIWPDIDLKNLCFVSPDEGGVKRVGFYRKKVQNLLNIDIATASIYKTHEGRQIEAHDIMGNVNEKNVIIIDDMISSGSTLKEASKVIESNNGKVLAMIATHGLFVGKAKENIKFLIDKGIKIITTDTVHTNTLSDDIKSQVLVIDTSSLMCEAIRRIHNEESISGLLA